jgi:nucleotide-binding universal stress UspA family protein
VALDPQLESSEGKLLGDALEAFRTIVVPLDGTPGAERVLPYAELLARASAGEIVLLRVTPRPAAPLTPIGQPVPGGGIDLSAAVDDERLKASADLETVRRRLVSRDFRVTTVVVTGSPDQEIVRRARALDADLIAMTTHARGGLQTCRVRERRRCGRPAGDLSGVPLAGARRWTGWRKPLGTGAVSDAQCMYDSRSDRSSVALPGNLATGYTETSARVSRRFGARPRDIRDAYASAGLP